MLDRDGSALAQLARQGEVNASPVTVMVLAHALVRLQRPQESLALLRAAQRRYPGDYGLLTSLGAALLRGNNRNAKEALRYRTAALAVRPKCVVAHYSLGRAFEDHGKLEAAIASFRRVIQLDPKSVSGHFALGYVLQELGRLDEAIESYRRAIEIDPKNPSPHNNLGIVLAMQGKSDEAIESYRRMLSVDPKEVFAHYNIGYELSRQGKVAEAIESYRRAIEVGPEYAPGHCSLGRALWRQGEWDEAISSYREAIRLDPEFALAHNNLAAVLLDQGKLDEAIKSSRRAIEIDPQHAPAHMNVGTVLSRQGDLTEAIRSYRRAIEIFSRQRGAFAMEWAQKAAQQIRVLESRPRLLAIARGEEKAESAEVWMSAAETAYEQAEYVASARTYTQAFVAHPELRDLRFHRYNAVCSLALAACGKGKGAKDLRETDRARLRAQAYPWLVAELSHLRQQVEREGKLAEAIGHLKHWQKDVDLSGIRDAEKLKALPAEEAQRWQKFWIEVKELLTKLSHKQSEGKR